jgi:hypothetical protein
LAAQAVPITAHRLAEINWEHRVNQAAEAQAVKPSPERAEAELLAAEAAA